MSFRRCRRSWRSLAAAAACAAGAGAGVGCAPQGDCWELQACELPPEPLPSPCDGDPATAPAVDGCGVFVSKSEAASDTNPGTRQRPFKTLQHAIDVAGNGVNRVYACAHRFEEEVTLTSGVDLWAGRDCEEGDWSVRWPAQLTTITREPVGVPLRVVAGKTQGAVSTIYGVQVVAADASASDRKSSIAVILSYGARVHLRSSEIVAGNGKDGEPGDDAPSVRAKDGVLGNDGADACTADVVQGAPAAVTSCDEGIESIGGAGGQGERDRGGDGAPGKPDPAEAPIVSGLGGDGDNGSTLCTEGKNGADGASRARSEKVTDIGSLSERGWQGTAGRDGARGGVGQGGGGGGGSRATVGMNVCPAGGPQGGPAGGSGGSGGCGGQGGKGGGYGGGSIAIVALESTVETLEAIRIATGQGGHGGVGGTGQLGGVGGYRGYGGHHVLGREDACDGGSGGDGGRGGDAGGGLGGATIGVASVAADVRFMADTLVLPGGAGEGGLAGNASLGDNEGKGGPGPTGNWVQFGAEVEQPR
jgi:hypothetical protein